MFLIWDFNWYMAYISLIEINEHGNVWEVGIELVKMTTSVTHQGEIMILIKEEI